MAKQYQERPSAILAVSDRSVAFFFDRAVSAFGGAVEADIQAKVNARKTETAKRLAATVTLNSWLQAAVGYRDPGR